MKQITQEKVVLLENIHPVAVEYFKNQGFSNIVSLKGSPNGDELEEILKDAVVLGIRSRTKLTADLLAKAPKLMAIGCFCIGTDQVDLNAAKEKGIAVFNAPFSNTRSVAELAMAEVVSLLRRVPEKNLQCHRGEWGKSATGCFEARGKTIGILGYGHIGMQVGVLAEAFGMEVIYYDVEKKLSLGMAKPVASLEELLTKADVLTIHLPGNEGTENIIGARELALMKKGSILLNLARGKCVVIDDLVEALKSEHIAGAGIDVFPKEPKTKDEIFESPLKDFDNVLLTPHIGGSTEEAQENIAQDVAEKLVSYVSSGASLTSVNFPEVAVKPREHRCRIIHIHKNLFGVMKQISKIFGDYSINIAMQYLQTNDVLGYVVMDIDGADVADEIIEKLNNIEHTIKTRKIIG